MLQQCCRSIASEIFGSGGAAAAARISEVEFGKVASGSQMGFHSKSLVSEGASDQGGLDGVCDASTKSTNMLRKKLPGPELLQAAR